jgi:hypothetical protein
MARFDYPLSGRYANRLLDELSAAANNAEMVFVDSWFYSPDALAGNAQNAIIDFSRPVKRFISPRVVINSDDNKTLFDISYVLAPGIAAYSLEHEAVWTMGLHYRRDNKLYVFSSNMAQAEISYTANKSSCEGYHGPGIFTEGQMKFPLDMSASDSSEIEYFKASCFILFNSNLSPVLINGPYGATECNISGSSCTFTHTFFNSSVVASNAFDVGGRWVQLYIWARMSDYVTEFRFVVDNREITNIELGSGFYGKMPAVGYIAFSNAFMDELCAVGSNLTGSPSPMLQDDENIVLTNSIDNTDNALIYDSAFERYLFINNSSETLTDPDTGAVISASGFNIAQWRDITPSYDCAIISCPSVNGILKLKNNLILIDNTVITSPVTAAARYRDGRMLAWVENDGIFYESDDGVTWNNSGIPVCAGFNIRRIRISRDNRVWIAGTSGSPASGAVQCYYGDAWIDLSAKSPAAPINYCYNIDSIGRSAFEIVGNRPVVIADGLDGSSDPGSNVFIWDDLTETWTEHVLFAGGSYFTLFNDGRFVYIAVNNTANTIIKYTGGQYWSHEAKLSLLANPVIAIAAHRRASTWPR